MTRAIGLYYPWIHFRDDDWVKVAMLYWQRLQRIVPEEYEKRDSATVRCFAQADLIGDHAPRASRKRVAAQFAAVITARGDELRPLYATDAADLWHHTAPMRHFAVPNVPGVGGDRFAYIHVDKIAYRLRETLIESGLGVANRGGDPNWLGVHPEIARVYMTSLAQDIAQHGGFQPLTEQGVDCVAVGGWSVERLAGALLPTSDAAQEDDHLDKPAVALAFYAIRSLIPKDVSTVSAERILEVRQKYGAELLDFQDSITALASDAGLDEVADSAALQLQLEVLYETRVAPKLKTLERDLRLFKLETVPTWLALKTTLPPTAALLATQAGLTEPTVGGAGAVALGLVGLRASAAADAKAKMRGGPAAYMFRIQEKLGPRTLRREIRAGLRHFSRGV